MALHRRVVHAHRLQQRVQRHVADVLVIIQQEAAQDVHGQNSVGGGRGMCSKLTVHALLFSIELKRKRKKKLPLGPLVNA